MATRSREVYVFGNGKPLKYPFQKYLTYATPHSIAEIVFQSANEQLELGDKVVLDMFAGVGSDSLQLAKWAGRVDALEVHGETYGCLHTNVESSGRLNVKPHRENALTWNTSGVDVVYVDPPWGVLYNKHRPFAFLDVSLGDNGQTIGSLLKELYTKHALVLKVPYNAGDISYLFSEQDGTERIRHIITFERQHLRFYIIASPPSEDEP